MEGNFSNAHKQFVFLTNSWVQDASYLPKYKKIIFPNCSPEKLERGYHIPEKLKTVKDSHHVCWVTSYLS